MLLVDLSSRLLNYLNLSDIRFIPLHTHITVALPESHFREMWEEQRQMMEDGESDEDIIEHLEAHVQTMDDWGA